MNSIGSAVILEDRSRGVEVVAKATRRRYTAEYKFKILREARGGPHPSDRGAAGLRCRSGVGFMPPRCSCPAVREVRADRSMLHRG